MDSIADGDDDPASSSATGGFRVTSPLADVIDMLEAEERSIAGAPLFDLRRVRLPFVRMAADEAEAL